MHQGSFWKYLGMISSIFRSVSLSKRFIPDSFRFSIFVHHSRNPFRDARFGFRCQQGRGREGGQTKRKREKRGPGRKQRQKTFSFRRRWIYRSATPTAPASFPGLKKVLLLLHQHRIPSLEQIEPVVNYHLRFAGHLERTLTSENRSFC